MQIADHAKNCVKLCLRGIVALLMLLPERMKLRVFGFFAEAEVDKGATFFFTLQ